VTDERVEEIVSELAAIVERLDEVAFDALRDAVADGVTTRPDIERRVVRARNAVERARRILEKGGQRETDETGAV
jgi:ElaB/YqjD/DUF883 family membrane-anchored ribosome-binding protein